MKINRFEQITEKKKNKIHPVGDYIWKKYLANTNVPGFPISTYSLHKIKEWESVPFLYFSQIHFTKHLKLGDVDSLDSSDLKVLLEISKEVEEFGEMTVKHGNYTGAFEIHMMFKDSDKLEKFIPWIKFLHDINKYNL